MAGGKYNDLRKLSHDIERKRKEVEDNKKQANLAHRDTLSKQMEMETKQRKEKVDKMAKNSHFARNMILIFSVGALLIFLVVVLKTVLQQSSDQYKPTLISEQGKALAASHEDYAKVNSFIQKLLAVCKIDDDSKIMWYPLLLSSQKDRSLVNLQKLKSGLWQISNITLNEKLGFYSVILKKQDSDEILKLRIMEDENYDLGLTKAY